ncbi:beta-ketoacyl synthase chain length factor [Acetobacter persici]|uniref:beta-ketoacyl synthase chain length factor n=1 Tax=Acetobacter persici TaxID=1076596 RepID=UPI00098D513A|nr:beta-ketoacyl synthase chain length factor [Acetobacter persici]
MRVVVQGVSVWGPGLSGWSQAERVLRGEEPWQDGPVTPPPAQCLPANERRRSGALTRLALALAEEACQQAALQPSALRGVFACSNSDGAVVDSILSAITTEDGEVSPTQFHNSVHNAPAGYWTIGHHTHVPVVALGCYDWSFTQGLLKAVAECVVEKTPTVLVVYDLPIPGPIGKVRITEIPFGCAFVLHPDINQQGICHLDIRYDAASAQHDHVGHPDLVKLMHTNPAAMALPLLEKIATGEEGCVKMACLPGTLSATVKPC